MVKISVYVVDGIYFWVFPNTELFVYTDICHKLFIETKGPNVFNLSFVV